MSILISIVVPCYNQVQYLQECLKSVINQTYQNWECIIVNDGSPDNTEEVALSICANDSRIKYLKKENGGISSARNAGIKIAKGEFILPLDADDKIGNLYLEKAVNAFSLNNEINLVYCAAKKFGQENEIWDLPNYSYKHLLIDNMIFCSAFFRRSDWEKVGGYDESFKSGLADWAFWIQILDGKSIIYKIPDILFYYRIKEVSMTTDLKKNNYNSVYWYLFEKNIDKYKSLNISPMSVNYENAEKNVSDIFKIRNSYSYKLGNKIVNIFKIFTFGKKI